MMKTYKAFMSVILNIWHFYTASKCQEGIKIVKTLAIKFYTFIVPC